ncbi:L-cystine transporter [Gordonibacter sp. 28C]|uniref:L-cystine transporter n=1 Tax=Gordonibacter sp. 28C TaxID=2078569 RepID=UPI000DF78293|nr:cation:dicarboxylase symporter family transporter [Gordonibacter sp. 28C]RDB61978.1 L-cystine transporter [Gordonibacter sp. 28C]
MSLESILPVLAVLAVFAALLAGLRFMKAKGAGFTPRVFTALGLGIVLGIGIQLALGRGSDAATTALDWMSIVGQGYIALLKMLVMPLVFVAIVGAFTRTKVTENLGRISAVVLAVLLGTVAVAALTGWAAVAFSGLAGASFTDGSVDATKLDALQTSQQQVADLTLPQEVLSFIPTNVFADLAGTRATSTIAVVIFSAIVGLAYLKLRDKETEQAAFFKQLIDSLYGIVMRIVSMVLALTPYGVLALIAHVMATSDYAAILDLGKFVAVSYGAIVFMFAVHCLILLGNRVNPLTYLKKAFPVLSFAFVARTSAGAMPLNIETQTRALGVDEATANFSASFGMSIGQNGCAGIYPAMLATIIAPTVGIDVLSPAFVAGLVAVVVISSFGVAGVGGGATFASLIVLGTMGLPIEIVGLLASVEPLIDMGRTALNVSDSMVAGVTASNAVGDLDRAVLGDPAARVSGEGHAGV